MTENINSSHTSDQSCEFVALIGLDWATEHHDFCLLDPTNNKTELGRFDHSPEKIGEWVIGLVERFGQGKIAICLEQSRGPLIYALLGYENLVLFPVNPKTISKLRSALYPNEPKDDRLDAKLALKMLILHREVLRPLQPLDAMPLRLSRSYSYNFIFSRAFFVGIFQQPGSATDRLPYLSWTRSLSSFRKNHFGNQTHRAANDFSHLVGA